MDMKRHITKVVAFVMTLMMILTSVPYAVLPVFASAVSGTTTQGEEGLEGFELRASEATLGKDIEYYALGESEYIDHTDGVVDSRLSAYEPFQTTNSLDPFLVGGDAWINLDTIYYGAPAMPNYATSKWSANTSVVNTTYIGYDEDGTVYYTFPDMNLIDETLWGSTLINFPYNSGEDGEENVNVDIEGVVSSKTAEYLNGAPAGTAVLSKNGVSAYAYNRYDDMQGKWGITADKNVKRLEFTPVNTELFLTKTPYLYFSNEQTDDTKMAISLLIGTPVIDEEKGNPDFEEPGVVYIYEKVSSDMDGQKPGRTDAYYAKLEVGDMFKTSDGTLTYIDSEATLNQIVSDNGLTDITVDGKAVNVKLYQNMTMYKEDENGNYIYEYKWYTVTDNLDRPGVENESRDFSMIPAVTVSDVASADGLVGGAEYVVPEEGYVTGAVTGCIDFTHLLPMIYSANYTGVKYDVAKVRVDMADVDEGRRNAGRINYLYFAPACEDTFTPQVNTGLIEAEDNAMAEGWENGACVTITDTPNNPQVITIDTTGNNGKPVYSDNQLRNNYEYYGNGKTFEEYKAAHSEMEDIDYVTVKIPVRKYINSLSDARKFTMKVDVLSWPTADGGSTTNPSQAVKKNNGETATPTIMLWGSKNGAAGTCRSYWYNQRCNESLNLGCRLANDGMLAVLGNGVYLAEPHYWYSSAMVDRTLGNSTDYDGAESWYDLLRSPYMYDETITSASNLYPEDMVGYVCISNITVCVPKGTVLTIKEARCSGNSAGMNMQDDIGDVVNAYDGGSGVNPVVNDNVVKGETNLTGSVVAQSGVNYSEKPAAYGPYLTFSDYTIGDLIDTGANKVYGMAFRDYKDTGNDKFHDAIYPMPKATYSDITYSYEYKGETVSKTKSNKPIGKIYTENSSVASYMVYATVYFDNGQKFGAVGVIRDTIQEDHDGDKYISDIGWVCLRTLNDEGKEWYLAEQCDYRGTIYEFGTYANAEAFLSAHPQWKQELRNAMIGKWVYSDLGGYGSLRYYDKDGNAYSASGKDAEYLTVDKAPDGNMLAEDYWLVDANGSSIYDSDGNYQWRYAPTLYTANQWRDLGGSNTYYQVAAYDNGALKPGTAAYFDDSELFEGVHNFELTWPYEYNQNDKTGVDHRGQSSDWSEFRAKLKSDAYTAIGLTRTLEERIMVRYGSTSGSMPALYYDVESNAGSATIGLLVAMPRKNAYGNTAYDDIQLWYINPSTGTLKKSISNKNFLGDGSTNSDTTHNKDQDSVRDSFDDEDVSTGYIPLDALLEASSTDRCFIVGIVQNMWNDYGTGTVKTTIRRLEVLYENEAWLDDINYGTVTDTTSIADDDKNYNLIKSANQSDGAVLTTYRSDGTLLLERTAEHTGNNMGYGATHKTTVDLSKYRYLHLTVNSEVPWLISMSESVDKNAWHSIGSTEAIRNQIGESYYTNTLSGSNTAIKAGQYRFVIDLHKVSTLGARDYKLASFYIELHGNGRLAVSEMVFSEKSTCTVPFPMLDSVYTYNIHETRNTTRTLAHDSYNILNDCYYYNQSVNVKTNVTTVTDTGKRGWSADLRTRGYNYYSDGTDTDPGTSQTAMQVIQNGGIDGLYQYKTSLGHVRLWTNPGDKASLVLDCDRTWDIKNYRYLYYSYSMRDDSGIAVEDEPNGSGVQLVLKTSNQNSGAAFVEQGDTWEYHTNYDSVIWYDGDTDWNTNNHGEYGISLGSGKTNDAPSKVNRCQCSRCLDHTSSKGEPEHTFRVSANAAVDLYDVYNQEVEATGAKNYAKSSDSTRTEASETAINQIVFYIENNLDTEAEFYINYIYLSNTPISDDMQPIFEMEEHQYYYLMDNTGSRYSARFPTLDNPTGQITGMDSTMQGGSAYRTQTRNNPVLVTRGDILEDGMFVNGQDFKKISDYVSMAESQAEAGSDKLWLKDGVTMTEAVWFYENHFDENIDGEQSAAPNQDILDYYKYIKADGTDGTVADLQWSLGRWYTGEGTDGLNVMKKDENNEVSGNLMKCYAVDNRVLLRSGIRPRTYTTYYDTDGGAMIYKGSSEAIKNGGLVNVDNYYITESTLNFFYTFPVDGSDVMEPYMPGYEFDGWEMMSDHGSQNPEKGEELRNYHAKDVAQVDYFKAKWKPADEYKDNTEAQNETITATFYRTDDGLKMTEDGTGSYTWFTRDTSWKKGFKLTLPTASLMKVNNKNVRVYGWEMVTYKDGVITRTGTTYNLGSTIWLLEDALFLPVLTHPEGNGKVEEPTVTITLTNAELWTFTNGLVNAPVGATGATHTKNGNTTTYVNVPRGALLVALPLDAYKNSTDRVWHLDVSADNVTNVSAKNVTAGSVGVEQQFVFAANGDYTLTYAAKTSADANRGPVWVQTNPSTYVENREMKFYSQYAVDSTATDVKVVACGTLYSKKGSVFNNIKDDVDNQMRINLDTVNANSAANGSYQTVNTSSVRHAMQDLSVLSKYTHQYYLMVTVKSGTATYYARSYVIYTRDNGQTYEAAYSDVIVSETVQADRTVI